MRLEDITFGLGILFFVTIMGFIMATGTLRMTHEKRCQQVCFDKGYPDARADTHLWDWTATCECIKTESE